MLDEINKSTLSNGIRILTHKMSYLRSVSMGVWVNVGSRDERPEENGLSHFMEHMIFKGTSKRSAFQIAKEFDAIGGQTNAFTTMENTCYHARVIDTHTDTMADILSDIFLNSVFDPEEVEKERPIILQEIGMIEDTPEDYVHLLSENAWWGDHPLGRSVLGTPENVSRFDAAAIKDFFRRFYQPEQIVIVAAGNIEHDRLVEMLGPAFESVKPGNGMPPRICPQGHPGISVYPRDLEQVHICMETNGISITDPRRFVFSILTTIFGANMSSRLFQEIRERRGLAYSVYSFVASYVDSGVFGSYAAVIPEKVDETVDVMRTEFRKLKESPVDDSELQDAKEYLKGNLYLSSESTDNQMVRLAQNEIHFGEYFSLQYVVDHIEAVTKEDVLSLAESLFGNEQFAVTMLGPIEDDHL